MEALLGVGADDNGMMWHEEAVMTYFSKKRQHIATYKTANDGTDVSAELASCNNSGEAEQFTDIVRPTPPGIDKHNYYFNQSHAASINSVWKTTMTTKLGLTLFTPTTMNTETVMTRLHICFPTGATP